MGDDPAVKGRVGREVRRVVGFVMPLVLVGLVWEALVRGNIVTLATLPPPSIILRKLWALSIEGVLLQHMLCSLYRLIVGYLLAAGLGIVLGMLLAMHNFVRDIFSPLLSLLISVPTLAWVPVLLITMGLGDRTVMTAVFLGGFFTITYNTMRGVEMVNEDLVNSARLMGVNGPKLLYSVLLPGSLVSIITGLRLGIGYSWRALVGGEMLAALVEWGIGKMVYQARFWNDVTAMFVGLIVIGFSGLLLDRVFMKWLEKGTVEKWGILVER